MYVRGLDKVIDEAQRLQLRPLNQVYVALFFDALKHGKILSKAVYY
jgi:hypothetical protein